MRWVKGLLPVNAALFAAAIGIYGSVKYSAELLALRGPLTVITAIFIAGPLASLGCLVARRPRAAWASLVLAQVLVIPILVHQTLPAVDRYRPIPRIARGLRAQMQPGDVLVALHMNEAASLRYYSQKQVVWVQSSAELAQALCTGERVYLIVPPGEGDLWPRVSLPASMRLQVEDSGYRIFLKDRAAPCPGARPTP
jgi:hypothetical protein